MISGFAQGKAAVSGIALSAKDDSNFSKAMVSVTLVSDKSIDMTGFQCQVNVCQKRYTLYYFVNIIHLDPHRPNPLSCNKA